MLTVVVVIGTRPEAIKMAPVVRQLQAHAGEVRPVVCSTGQHRELLDPVYRLFGIVPDVELGVMRPNQGLSDLTARLLHGFDRTLGQIKPDWVLAQGDTTTVLAAALVAYFQRIKFGHVEAGLRTGDRYQPFPEEVNRKTADAVAELLFAPTEGSRQNLLREGHPEARIRLTGNTGVDALHLVAAMPYQWSDGPLSRVPTDKRLVLVTAHRREHFGAPLRRLCRAIHGLAEHYAGDGVHFVCPVHPNPNVRTTVAEILASSRGVSLLEPLDYLSLVHLLKRSCLVLTDSGGIQEEAVGLGIPVLVTREKTERPEGIAEGGAKLVGACRERIMAEARAVLDESGDRRPPAPRVNPYGDGQAARRIVSALLGAGPVASADGSPGS
jgi:UDP-N-acetylglucosamine 2-epimerase